MCLCQLLRLGDYLGQLGDQIIVLRAAYRVTVVPVQVHGILLGRCRALNAPEVAEPAKILGVLQPNADFP